jgi:hypothetical protein
MKNKRTLPPTYVLMALVAMLVLHFAFPGIKLIPLSWNLLGRIPPVSRNPDAAEAFIQAVPMLAAPAYNDSKSI